MLSRKYFVPEHTRSTKIMLPRVSLDGGVTTKATFVSFPLSSNYQMELTYPELENDWQTNNVVPAPLSCNVSLRIIEWVFKFLSVLYLCYIISWLPLFREAYIKRISSGVLLVNFYRQIYVFRLL